jgi:hypothetical protein
VWPTGSTIKTRDTIKKTVKVFDASSIWSIAEEGVDRVSLFPNPATYSVTVKMLDGNPYPDHILIVDSRGCSWEIKPDAEGNIDVSQFPAGLYHLRLAYRNGDMISRKFMVSK